MALNELTIVIRAKSFLKKNLARAQTTLAKFRGVVAAAGKRIAAGFRRAKVALAALVAGMVAAVRHAAAFRAQMAQVSVMLGENQKMLAGMTEGVIKMSAEFGESKEALSKGLYDILSAGIDAGGAMDVLRVAMKAAVGGATDVATSVDALTTILNAYGLQADQATHVSDVLFQVVKDGKITYAELAENVGKLAPTARAAGVSLENMGALIAALVKVEKPERAMTALRAAMFKAAEGGETLFQLVERFKGKGLEEIVGAGVTKRAAAGVAILAQNFDVLQEEIRKFSDVTGAAEEAFKRVEDTRIWARAWQSALAIATKLGEALGTKLRPQIEALVEKTRALIEGGAIDAWAAKAANAMGALIPLVKLLGTVIKGISTGILAVSVFTAGAFEGRIIPSFKAGKKAVDDLIKSNIEAEGKAKEAAAARARAAEEAKKNEEREKRISDFKRSQADVEAILARHRAKIQQEEAERQKKINKLKEKEAEIIAKLKDKEENLARVRKQQAVIANIEKRIEGLGRAAEKREELAGLLVPEFIARQKQKEKQERDKLDEDLRINKLRAKQERGIRLSKRDRDFLKAVDQREVIRRQAVLDRAEQRKLQDRLKKEREKLATIQKESRDELKKIRTKLDKLLQMK